MLHCRCHVLSNSTWSYCSDTVPILFPLVLLQINSAGFCEILQPIQTLKLPLHSSACTGTKMWLLIFLPDFDCCTTIAWEQFLTCWVFAPEILRTVWSPKKHSMWGMPDEHLIRHPIGTTVAAMSNCLMWTSCLVPSHQVAELAKALQEMQKVRSMFWTCQGKKSKWSRVVQETHKRQFIIQTPLFHSADFLKVSYWTWRSWRKPKAHCNAKCTDSPCLGQAESQAPREQAQSLHLEASLSFGRVCH